MANRENPLTPIQAATVQSNLHLVDTILRTHIHHNENVVGLSYDDLRQEGYILLCNAVRSYNPEVAKLSTYAYKVIYNGLISHCRRINRQEAHISALSLTEYMDRLNLKQDDLFPQRSAELDLESLLNVYAKEYSGITKQGIRALLLNVKGMPVTQIAQLYQVPPSHIGAWISRAKSKLKNNKQFLKDIA